MPRAVAMFQKAAEQKVTSNSVMFFLYICTALHNVSKRTGHPYIGWPQVLEEKYPFFQTLENP